MTHAPVPAPDTVNQGPAPEPPSTARTPKADPGPGEQFQVRADKRQRLRDEGWDPYPVSVPVTTTISAVREAYGHLQAGQETDDVAGVAGRVVFLRNTGRLCFVTLADGAGTTLQAMLSAKALPASGHTALAAFKTDVDLGDHLFVHGRVICSRRGELSVMAEPVLRQGVAPADAGDDDVAVLGGPRGDGAREPALGQVGRHRPRGGLRRRVLCRRRGGCGRRRAHVGSGLLGVGR